nr:choice-of-anchor D domain-containing protein [Hymenobacter cyanobacteriorum]
MSGSVTALPTITTGTVAPSSVVQGGSVVVPYTTSGTFGTGNVFAAELSTATGTFPGTALTTTASSAGSLTVTIPAATAPGTAYTIRVNASSPAVNGTASGTFAVTAAPAGGQLLLYDFSASATNPNAPTPPTPVANTTASDFAIGGGITQSTTTGVVNTSSYNTTTPTRNAPTTDEYLSFSFTPNTGYGVSLSEVSFKDLSSSTGPTNTQVFYSFNASFTNAVQLATNAVSSATLTSRNIALSGIADLQNATGTIYFRVFPYGATGATGSYRIDDVALTGTVQAAPVLPEINVVQGTTAVGSGDTYNFGQLQAGALATATFTIQNLGLADLSLTGTPSVQLVTGSSADYVVTAQPAAATVGSGSSTTFTVTFSPTSGATQTATLSIASNDQTGNEAPYLITLTGSAVPLYTWNGTGTSWNATGSWTPARTTPGASDILVFDGSNTSTATITTDFTSPQTVGQLLFRNNVVATFNNTANRTLTIANGNAAGADLQIEAGSRLTVFNPSTSTTATGLTLQLGTGATTRVAGTLVFNATTLGASGTGAHRLLGSGAGSIDFVSGSSFIAGLNFSGNPFGAASAYDNNVVFRSGSRLEQAGGLQPFGLTAPATVLTLEPGSSYVYSVPGNSTPPLSSRSFGNLEFNTGSGIATSTANGTLNIAGNLVVSSGTINLNLDNTISIGGNLVVNAGSTLSFVPDEGGVEVVSLNGSAAQTISGAGTLTFGATSNLQVNNAAGVTLARALTLNRLTLTNGALALNGNTLTVTGPLAVDQANGFLQGSAASSLVLTGTGTLANVNTTAGAGSTFGTLTLNRTDAGTLAFNNSVTLNGLTLTAGTLAIGSNNTLTLNGPVAATAATGYLQGSATSSLSFTGASATTGLLAFTPGAGSSLQSLTLNQSTNTLIPVASTLTIGTLDLTVGSLLFAAPARAIVGTLATPGNANSFVSAVTLTTPVSAAPTLTFPLGAALNRFRPLTLAATQASSATAYTARVTEQSANSRGVDNTNGGALTRVSRIRYYSLAEEVTTNFQSGVLTLSFGTGDVVTDLSSLRLARSASAGTPFSDVNPSNTPPTAVAGNASSGTITDAIGALGDFALGTTALTDDVNPLPVELTAFSAQRQADKTVTVKWNTASEKNSARFEVQRSSDGREYTLVASAAAQGSSSHATAYAAVDKAAPAGKLYYRLRQVDLDGTAAFSPVVTVAGSGAAAKVALYPNPAHSRISFAAEAATPYRVLNQLGQPLLHGTTEAGPASIGLETLPTGLYFLELQTATGRTVQKFEKE